MHVDLLTRYNSKFVVYSQQDQCVQYDSMNETYHSVKYPHPLFISTIFLREDVFTYLKDRCRSSIVRDGFCDISNVLIYVTFINAYWLQLLIEQLLNTSRSMQLNVKLKILRLKYYRDQHLTYIRVLSFPEIQECRIVDCLSKQLMYHCKQKMDSGIQSVCQCYNWKDQCRCSPKY